MNTEKRSSKKGLIIAALVLAAIAAAAGAFWAYKNHQEKLSLYRDVADPSFTGNTSRSIGGTRCFGARAGGAPCTWRSKAGRTSAKF